MSEVEEKARAWDTFVRKRLSEGYTQAQQRITCMSNDAVIEITDMMLMTPFGNATVHDQIDGTRIIKMQKGDSIVIGYEVKLSIS